MRSVTLGLALVAGLLWPLSSGVVLAEEPPASESDDPLGSDWPAGPGREEAGYLCSACHSLAIVKQQGLTRARWDELLVWMAERQGMPEPEPAERVLILDFLAANFGDPAAAAAEARTAAREAALAIPEDDPFGRDWPLGPGREVAGGWCDACHSLAIVKQQGLSRGDWDELLVWMAEEQGMPELEAPERDLILDYLAKNFGRDRRAK